MQKISYFIISLLIIFVISSCTNNNVLPTQKPEINIQKVETEVKKKSSKIKLSNQGKHFFDILVDKEVPHKFVKIIPSGETYDKTLYEHIEVYSEGFYPSYEPNSIFKDNTFDGVKFKKPNEKNPPIIIIDTSFDKDKFLKVAQLANNTMYSNIKFTVHLNVAKDIDEEYTMVELLIKHKPNLKLEKILFFVNGSAMYGDLIGQEITSVIEQKHIYKLAIPNGKNRVKVELSLFTGEKAIDKTIIENKFATKPTFHVLVIGVNEFPNWGKNHYLENAINDANLVKKILRQRSSILFENKINFNPYILDITKTTKEHIEKLVDNIINKVKPNDYFLFYVASHGFIEDNKYYFAPSDFEKSIFVKNQFTEEQISEY